MEADNSIVAAPKRVVGRPWPKGVSGNPGGRAARPHALIEALERAIELEGRDALAEKAVSMAMSGDAQMMKYVIDRVAGPAEQTLIHKVEDAAQRIAQAQGVSVEEVLEQAIESVGRDKLAEKAVSMAMSGDAQMMKYVIDRVAGPATQTLVHKVEEAAQRIAQAQGIPIEEVYAEAKQLAQGT